MIPRGAVALAPVAAWATAMLCTWTPPVPGTGAAFLLAAAALVLSGPRAAWRGAFGVVLVIVGVIAVSVQVQDALRHPSGLTQGARVRAVVELTSSPDDRGTRFGHVHTRTTGRMLLAQPLSGSTPVGASHAMAAPVVLLGELDSLLPEGAGPPPALSIGTTLEVDVLLRATEPSDSAAWVLVSPERLVLVSSPPPVLAVADGLRADFRTWASRLPGDGGALLPGLAIGDTSAVSDALDSAMIDSSLSHLTAVSGANCALVVAGVSAVIAILGGGTFARGAGAVLALSGFVVLVTPQPSVLRAAVMALAILVAGALGRPRAGTAALGIAVIVLLVHDPWLAREAGFALSAAATAGLLLLAGPLADAAARLLPRPLALAVAIPTAAQLACQPILILLDPRIPLLSVPANLLAGPAAPFATIFGLLACLLLPVTPALGALLGTIGWAPSAWIAAVARFFAQVPVDLPWLPGALGAVVLGCAVLLIGRGLLRRSALTVVAGGAVVILVVAAMFGTRWGRAASLPSDWRLASCDVGQGAATLIRGGPQAIGLIDTGDDPELLEKCLDLVGVDRLDLLVLTHFDRDHIGAAPLLVGRVDHLLVGPSDGDDADALVESFAATGTEVRLAEAGDGGMLGDLAWSALWPHPDAEPGNDASVVLDVRGSDISAVVLGDLGQEAQRALLRRDRPRPVDIVGVSHHGSADQDPSLYARLGARLALVSVGADNTYGHPAPSLLEMLEAAGSRIERTDRAGTVVVSGGRDGLRLWTERDDGGDG